MVRRRVLAALLPLCVAAPLWAQSPAPAGTEAPQPVPSAAMQRLEADLAQLRAAAARTRADADSLRQLLDAPPAGLRIPLPLQQGLLVLLLAAAAGGGLLWWRTARQGRLAEWQADPMDSDIAREPVAVARPLGAAAVVSTPTPAPAPPRARGQWELPPGFVGKSAQPAPVELEPLEFELDLDLDVPVRKPRGDTPR